MQATSHTILGWTGLVGQTLFHQLTARGITDIACYNSKNILDAKNTTTDTLYICCMPAKKWWANSHPTEDAATLDIVLNVLDTIKAKQYILISTVDVIVRGDEESTEWTTHPYGIHRRRLEESVLKKPNSHILRLPALFGRGLKKNALYDLLHDNQVSNICPESTYQWYNLANLLRDCDASLDYTIMHLVSAPVTMREIMEAWFPNAATTAATTAAATIAAVNYCMETKHAGTPDGPYWTSKSAILRQMGEWILWEQWRLQRKIAASNIGWSQMSDDVATSLQYVGITALEIAPTRGRVFGCIKPISMQSLLYGTSIRNIFHERDAFLRHLEKLMEVANKLEITTMVMGCPKQRSIEDVSWLEIMTLMQRVGDLGAKYNITVCVEPNAQAYGCTWLTNIADTLHFLYELNHPHVRLSLDTGNAYMEQDPFVKSISSYIHWIGHVQVSAAHLANSFTKEEKIFAQQMLERLFHGGYTGTISYEAREAETFTQYLRGCGEFADILQNAVRIAY